MNVVYVCTAESCDFRTESSWKAYNPLCPRCGGKVVAEDSVVRPVEQRRADYEAHIDKTYREVWRWLERELGDDFTRERRKQLISIFNNPYGPRA